MSDSDTSTTRPFTRDEREAIADSWVERCASHRDSSREMSTEGESRSKQRLSEIRQRQRSFILGASEESLSKVLKTLEPAYEPKRKTTDIPLG